MSTLPSFEPKKTHCEQSGCISPPQFRINATGKELCKEHLKDSIKEGDETTPLLSGFKLTKEQPKQIKARKVSEKEMREFVGKTLRMKCGTVVKVERIQGSMIKPALFEINNAYHINMLDAFKQLYNDDSITQQMIDDFETIAAIEIVPIAELEKRMKAGGQNVQN